MPVTRGKSTKQKAQAILRTERQAQTVQLGLSGIPMTQIARQFGVSIGTVSNDYASALKAAEARRKTMGNQLLHEQVNQTEYHIAQLEQALHERTHAEVGPLDSLEHMLMLRTQLLRWYQERAKLLDLYPTHQAEQTTTQQITIYQLNWDSSAPAQVEAQAAGNTVQGKAQRRLSPSTDASSAQDIETVEEDDGQQESSAR